MIERTEMEDHARSWGVTVEQVRKDHLISHLLQSLGPLSGFVFFGGTALNRAFLEARRLSEDIDLYLLPDTGGGLGTILDGLLRGIGREYPDARVVDGGARSDVHTYLLSTEGVQVQLQIVAERHEHRRLPTGLFPVALRYSDLPECIPLLLPTRESFVAMKCAAFEDRATPRDLFDLGALEEVRAITPAAVETLRAFRGTGPVRWRYDDAMCPEPSDWSKELAHQTGHPGEPSEVLQRVRHALTKACEWPEEADLR